MARTNGLRTDSVQTLVDSLGAWSSGSGALYAQLAAALQRSVERGDLQAGGRLPSERQLSLALGVSRTTVVAAYDQLRSGGHLHSHRGSGTRVAHDAAGPVWTSRASTAVPDGIAGDGPFAFTAAGGDIELTIGALPGAALIAGEAERVAREDLPELLRSFGYQPYGHPPLRDAVAAHLTNLGVPTDSDQVLVTSGAQQAIDLLARQVGGPDASVIIENPTYPPAIDVFRASGANLVPIPLDDAGVRTDLLRAQAQRRPGQIVYLNPSCHNPSGTVLSEPRRREVARIAAENGLLVIDDMTSAYLAFGNAIPAPLAQLDRGERILTVGSLSKVAWGGLRIGWIRGPQRLIGQLAARKIGADFSTSLFNQALAVRLFGRIDELVPLVRQGALERLEVLEAALRRRLPGWRWTRPAGGACLWVRLPAGDAATFARLAAEHGVIVRPGPLFSADGGSREYLRLAYGHEPEILEQAVERLADAWSEFRPNRPSPIRNLSITV